MGPGMHMMGPGMDMGGMMPIPTPMGPIMMPGACVCVIVYVYVHLCIVAFVWMCIPAYLFTSLRL